MKKFLSTLTAAVCVLACAFAFTACGGYNGGNDNQTHTAHTWSTTYTQDGDRHYQTCDGCDEKNYSNHDYGTSGVCVCGKEKPVAHSHNWSTTYIEDGDRHYQTCDGCTEKQYNNHDYGTSGTCVCGKEKPVTTVEVTGVTLNESELTLEIGGTYKLTAVVKPDNATDKTVAYSVEPAGIVTVDNDGNVTAVAAGTATITATTANSKTATCSVTVNAPLTNAQVLKYLNDNVLMEAAKESLNKNWEVNETNVKNATWVITKDGKNITGANLLFNYLRRDTATYITLCKIEFGTPLSVENIKNGTKVNATYTQIYAKAINPTIQAEHTALTNAICDKLFGENQNATRYIIDNQFTAADPNLGDVSKFAVIEITDTYIKEKSIKIKYANSDSGLIEKLSDSANYATYGEEKTAAITGTKLENNDLSFFGNSAD